MIHQSAGAMAVRQARSRWLKGTLFLVSVTLSAAMFLTLDWLHSRPIRLARMASAKQPYCLAFDPIRDHSLKPNCARTTDWGGHSYEMRTNSLGLRDEKIREVPLVDPRPRILMLGDSFTQAMLSWSDSFVGMVAAHFPQYDILNGGVVSYSPSNYFNTTRLLLAQGVHIDEVIVFVDISDVADEAHIYQDADAYGAVTVRPRNVSAETRVAMWDSPLAERFLVTNSLYTFFRRILVSLGFYQFTKTQMGDPFDGTRGAWTYKSDSEFKRASINSYEPLGVEGGIAKEKTKMTLLWRELEKRNIPISVVVYPWPGQLIHDTEESRQVSIWRDWCEGKCKRFITLFPAFFAMKNQCPRTRPGCWYSRYFIFGDIHYNTDGNALVASAVIKSLTDFQPAKREEKTSGP